MTVCGQVVCGVWWVNGFLARVVVGRVRVLSGDHTLTVGCQEGDLLSGGCMAYSYVRGLMATGEWNSQ